MTQVTRPESSTSSKEENGHAGVSKIGWSFLQQYYTSLNQDPTRQHCYYNKQSTALYGVEGETLSPSYGTQEINSLILSLDYENVKVYLSTVDCQSSANSGIIIQVVGEISNRNQPWRKFAQTFFLAEQPNGYFVLNDICRFMKEDNLEDVEVNGETAPELEHPAEEAPVVDEPSQLDEPVPEAKLVSIEPNGIPEPVAEPVEIAPFVESVPAETPVEPASEPQVLVSLPATPEIPYEDSTPATSAPPSEAPVPAVAEKAAEAQEAPAPKGPSSWASLAATGASKWGAKVVDPKPVISSTVPAAQPPAQAITSAQNQNQNQNQKKQGKWANGVADIPNAVCFAKQVVSDIPAEEFKKVFTERFGPMKECDIQYAKTCAFITFESIESARKAIQASLPVSEGGEGGIKFGKNTVFVALKKQNSNRGNNRGGRGGANGRAGGPNRGRGKGAGQQAQ